MNELSFFLEGGVLLGVKGRWHLEEGCQSRRVGNELSPADGRSVVLNPGYLLEPLRIPSTNKWH